MTDLAAETVADQQLAFGPLTIAYSPAVLEPRTWTQAQSRWAAELLRTAPDGPVLELCSGAGHIGLLALALSGGRRRMVAVDANPEAVRLMRINAERAGLDVDVRLGDVSSTLDDDERFAVVVADPPWVPTDDIGRFPEDPVLAIDGGADGLDLARTCLRVAGRHLSPGGHLLLQLGTHAQAEALDPGLLREIERRTYERGVLIRYDA
jgi:methylase of polypeptide subunit release factors